MHTLEDSPGMCFSEVRGFGRSRISRTRPPLIKDLLNCRPCARIEILSADDQVCEIVSTFKVAASIGQAGSGKILVLDSIQTDTGKAEAQGETAITLT